MMPPKKWLPLEMSVTVNPEKDDDFKCRAALQEDATLEKEPGEVAFYQIGRPCEFY